MPDTSLGITYPASTEHTRTWEHMQALAQDVNDLIAGGRVSGSRIATGVRDAVFTNITGVEVAIDWITVPLVAGRTYRVRWTAAWGSSVAGDTAFSRLRQDSVAGTLMQIVRVNIAATGGAGTRWDGTVEAEYTATATGNKTFYATGVRATGTGSLTVQGDPTFPVYLTVDYIRG